MARAAPNQTPTTAPGTPANDLGTRVPMPPVPARRYHLPREVHRFFPTLAHEADHPTSWRFPGYLDPAVPWVAVLRDLYSVPASFPASVSPEAGLLLHSLVRNIRPRTVVEVGSFLGASTIWIASALEASAEDPAQSPPALSEPRGQIHTFDDFGPMAKGPWRDVELPSRLPIVQENLLRAGLDHRVMFHPGDSAPEIRAFRDQLRPGGVDFALIDGNHTIPGVLEDLWAIEPVLNTGGYVLLHDTFPEQCGDHDGPRHAIDHMRTVAQGLYEPCELYTAPLNYGMALLRRVG